MSDEKPKLGEILLKSGALSLRDLENFLQQQEELKTERGYQTKLGTLLLEHKLLNEETLALAFAEQQNIEYQELTSYNPDLTILEKIPYSILMRFKFVPLYMDSSRMVIAINDPIDTFLFDLLYKALGVNIEYRSATRSGIDYKHKECLQAISDSGRMNQDFDIDFEEYRLILQQEKKGETKEVKDRPEVSLQNNVDDESLEELLKAAFRSKMATAMQIRPMHGRGWVEFKINNKWEYFGDCSEEVAEGLNLRIKSMTDYKDSDISYLTQAFFEIPFSESDYQNFSVTFLPQSNGTEIVVEPYPMDHRAHDINKYGLLSSDLEKIAAMDLKKRGILILGGKSMGKSTLYQALLNNESLAHSKVISMESNPLSSNCRVSRIPLDADRNQLQFLSSLQGHSYDCVGMDGLYLQESISCLRFLGKTPAIMTCEGNPVLPSLISLEKQGDNLGFLLESFQAIIFLKLVPALCPYCIQPHRAKPDEIAKHGLKPETLKKPFFYFSAGCDYCEHKGYTEFTPVYELLYITPQVQKIMQENMLGNELAMHLLKGGSLVPVNNVAKEKLYKGVISLQTYANIIQKKI